MGKPQRVNRKMKDKVATPTLLREPAAFGDLRPDQRLQGLIAFSRSLGLDKSQIRSGKHY